MFIAWLFGAVSVISFLGGQGAFAEGELETFPESVQPSEADLPLSGADKDASSPVLLTIPLQKQYVPMLRDGKTVAYKTAYFGTVRVGDAEPRQNFTVVFDTGSGHLILPSTSCHSETCTKHRRYNRTLSPSAIDVEYDGTPIRPDATERDQVAIAFGTGEVLGEFVQEVVCVGAEPHAALGRDACVRLRTVLATRMTPDPFGLFAFDGVLGLGLDALTLAPQFSLLSQMFSQNPEVSPRFSVFLARSDDGESEISFGGHDRGRAASALEWAVVAKAELGYWQVEVKAVRIGGNTLDECADGSCRAILDTGTSLLGVPRSAARTMHRLLARHVPESAYSDASQVDCRTVPGNRIDFELASGAVVSLDSEDYSRPTPFNMTLPATNAGTETANAKLFCRSLLLPVDMQPPLGPKIFIWGEPFLRRYYTVYDPAEKQVGFALARQSLLNDGRGATSGALPAVGAPPPGSLVSGAPLPPLQTQRAQPAAII